MPHDTNPKASQPSHNTNTEGNGNGSKQLPETSNSYRRTSAMATDMQSVTDHFKRDEVQQLGLSRAEQTKTE